MFIMKERRKEEHRILKKHDKYRTVLRDTKHKIVFFFLRPSKGENLTLIGEISAMMHTRKIVYR